MRLVSLLFVTASVLTAQSPLTTTFANNNQGSPGGAIYFDLSADADAVIFDFDLNFGGAAGTAGSVTVYTIPGTAFGQETNMAAWTVHDTATVAATAGAGMPSNCQFDTMPLLVLTGSPIGMAIVCDTPLQHTYTTGTAPFPLVYETCPLTLTAGTATNAPFTGNIFMPRVPNTNINFLASGCATVEEQGAGCVSPNALTLSPTSGRPVQGAAPAPVVVTTTNIDAGALLHLGVTGVTRPGLPLTVIGFPQGCTLWASADLTQLAVGPFPAGTLTWTPVVLPAAPPLTGLEFNTQAVTFDAGVFGPGGRASNGLKYVIGTL